MFDFDEDDILDDDYYEYNTNDDGTFRDISMILGQDEESDIYDTDDEDGLSIMEKYQMGRIRSRRDAYKFEASNRFDEMVNEYNKIFKDRGKSNIPKFLKRDVNLPDIEYLDKVVKDDMYTVPKYREDTYYSPFDRRKWDEYGFDEDVDFNNSSEMSKLKRLELELQARLNPDNDIYGDENIVVEYVNRKSYNKPEREPIRVRQF